MLKIKANIPDYECLRCSRPMKKEEVQFFKIALNYEANCPELITCCSEKCYEPFKDIPEFRVDNVNASEASE